MSLLSQETEFNVVLNELEGGHSFTRTSSFRDHWRLSTGVEKMAGFITVDTYDFSFYPFQKGEFFSAA